MLVFQFLAVAVESSDYILLLSYEHSLLQLVDHLFFLLLVVQLASLVLELVFLVEEPALVVVVQLVFL